MACVVKQGSVGLAGAVCKTQYRKRASFSLFLVIFQSFDSLLEAAGNGQPVELSSVPPPPGKTQNLAREQRGAFVPPFWRVEKASMAVLLILVDAATTSLLICGCQSLPSPQTSCQRSCRLARRSLPQQCLCQKLNQHLPRQVEANF